MYYGCHMPNQNANLLKSIIAINNLGGNCLQVFISNPMSGQISDKHFSYYINDTSKDIKKSLANYNTKLFIHSSYTYNFALQKNNNQSYDDCYWISNYIKELEIAHHIGAVGNVIHVGKSLKLHPDIATNIMFDSLSYIITKIKEKKLKSIIILETCAGQGTELFRTSNNNIDLFANFYNKFDDDSKKYIKLCVDTCHIFVAGYDIRKSEQVKNFFIEFDQKIGINNLVLIHLNDSRKEYNSCVDRHENIGNGFIGTEGLTEVIKHANLYKIPLILETPEPNEDDVYVEHEIAFIKNIIDNTH